MAVFLPAKKSFSDKPAYALFLSYGGGFFLVRAVESEFFTDAKLFSSHGYFPVPKTESAQSFQ